MAVRTKREPSPSQSWISLGCFKTLASKPLASRNSLTFAWSSGERFRSLPTRSQSGNVERCLRWRVAQKTSTSAQKDPKRIHRKPAMAPLYVDNRLRPPAGIGEIGARALVSHAKHREGFRFLAQVLAACATPSRVRSDLGHTARWPSFSTTFAATLRFPDRSW